MGMLEKKTIAPLLLMSALMLSACQTADSDGLSSFGNPMELPDRVDPYPDSEVLQVAKARFAEASYGHAARYYERAVEVMPNNGEAWLGLAASYDRVRRFDLADRAYREAGRILGKRAEYYNNIGYSYMLRGDAGKARTYFLKAQELDPASPTINNNLEMLREGVARSKRV
jgi:Flp pilus assembly protein TadD